MLSRINFDASSESRTLSVKAASPQSHWRWIVFGYPAYWICQGIGWFGSASGEITVSLLHSRRSMLEVGFSLLGALLGVAVSHLLRGLIWWRNWFAWPWHKQLLCYLIACIPASMLYAAFFLPLVWHFDPYETTPDQQIRVVFDTLYWTYSALLVWCGFYFGWHYFLNYQQAALDRARLDAALNEAELRALRGQLNPHFLFNALNSIRSLIESNPARARDAITLLANLLRGSLNSSEHKVIPLARELEAVESYLALELIRLEDRLRLSWEIPAELRKVNVPPLCVQTLVENAVKHGISPSTTGGSISITGHVEADTLVLRVVNAPGSLQPPPYGRSPGTHSGGTGAVGGVGLRNLEGRMRLLFGTAASVSLREIGAPGCPRVMAELRLPLESRIYESVDYRR